MRHLRSHVASVVGLGVLAVFALGSGKGSSSSSEGGVATTPVDDKPKILGRCLKKGPDALTKSACEEYYGLVPSMAGDLCDGEFKKEANLACPKDKLVGTCHYKAKKTGDPGSFSHYYPPVTAAEGKECTTLKADWTEAPAAAATTTASAAAPASAASAPPGKKAPAKPAGSAKK